jgi:hypothetical protein
VSGTERDRRIRPLHRFAAEKQAVADLPDPVVWLCLIKRPEADLPTFCKGSGRPLAAGIKCQIWTTRNRGVADPRASAAEIRLPTTSTDAATVFARLTAPMGVYFAPSRRAL